MNDFSNFDVDLEPERYELNEQKPPLNFEHHRRDFLKTLGGGMLVFYLLDAAEAQPPAPGQGRRGGGGGGGRGRGGQSVPQEIGAWLHIGEDGHIKVFTGKAEVGQNIRTSLTQVVAEELHVPPASIEMVMADTQLTPFDMGTFGSRTTPDMARRLRRTAAAARETLVELAAETAKVDRASLRVADGTIVNTRTGESLAYGALTQGKKLTRVVSEQIETIPPEKWTIAGHSAAKVDGRSFVTGQHRYASDIRLPGMWFGKVLRPSSIGARLAKLDATAVKAMTDVILVQDGDFVGVAAPTHEKAAEAIAALKAEWTPGPEISGKRLFDDFRRLGQESRASREHDGQEKGSMRAGLAAADVRLEQSYPIAYIAHAPLEPRAAVARWEDGKLTVWTGTQRPFGVRADLSAAFRTGLDDVRVIVPDTGSGYGGKHTGEAAIEAARLARAAKKPVKLVWTREEEFTWAYFRPAGLIEISSGVTRDGRLTAWGFHNYNSGASGIRPLYEVPNQLAAFHSVPSPLRQGSYRALASTANHFARESHMDELAHAIKIDPLEFRLKNLKDSRLRAVLEAAAGAFGWPKRNTGADHGIGIAGGSEKGSYVATCAEVAVNRSTGKVEVIRATSAYECGAIINPDQLKNQVEGAMVMGLGGALFEAIEFEDGRILNARFSKYRVPRFRDTPRIEVVLLDRKDIAPAGAGETPIVAIAPAIGNAIFDAVGIRLRSLPMVPNGLKI